MRGAVDFEPQTRGRAVVASRPMSPRLRCPSRSPIGRAALVCALLGCGDAGQGIEPPSDQIFFPSGLALDPRVGAGEAPRWLFVASANSDLVYNAGTIAAIDLDAFFRAWADVSEEAGSGRLFFSQKEGIGAVGAAVSDAAPCRRIAGLPQAVECTEEPFIAAETTARVGSFSTVLRAWDHRTIAAKEADPSGYALRLFFPVRGDPSVSFVDVEGGLSGEPLAIRCDASADRPELCALDDRTRFLRGDREIRRIAREPNSIFISDRLAFVTHNDVPEVTLIGLYGLHNEYTKQDTFDPFAPARPIVLDIQRLFGTASFIGGYGIAQRPCDPGDLDGDGLADNAAKATYVDGVACARPLLYAANRREGSIVRFSVGRITPAGAEKCVDVADLDQPGAILCEDRLQLLDSLFIAGYDPGTTGTVNLGALAFSRDGDALYVVQSNPGALVRVDTSLDDRGETRDITTGIVELCSRPTAMVAFQDGASELAAVSCYSSGAIFIVDLVTMQVVDQIFAGAGAHEMVHDPRRGFLYVANTLDATISVIDVAPHRPTRFSHVARIGLQEPYSG
jgi:hypothetical protein